MTRLGADPTQLREVAHKLRQGADQLANSAGSVDWYVRRTFWVGPEADAFRGRWSRVLRYNLYNARDQVAALATQLEREARQQERASSSSSLGTVPKKMPKLPRWLERVIRWSKERVWFATTGRDQLLTMVDASPADQLAWWNGLHPDQQAFLLERQAAALLALDGLPADVRQAAVDAYLDDIAEDVAVSTIDDYAKLELDFVVAEIGLEGHLRTKEMADGSYVVEIEFEGEAGAKIAKVASAGVEGSVSLSYRFDSAEEAEAFKKELMDSLRPGWDEVGGAVLSGISLGLIKPDPIADAKGVLDKYDRKREEARTELGVTAGVDAELGFVDAEASAAVGGFYDHESGERGIYLEFEAAAELNSQASDIDAEIDLSTRAEVVFDENNQLVGLKIKGEVSAKAGMGVEDLLGTVVPDAAGSEGQITAGARAHFEAELDLSDPITRRRAEQFVEALKGQGGSPADGLTDLLDRSEMIFQVDGVVDANVGIDVDTPVVDLEVGSEASENLVTYVKPPSSGFVKMETN